MEDVALTKRPICLNKSYFNSFLKQKTNMNLVFKDDMTFFVDILGSELDKKGKLKSNGRIRVQIDILPSDQAEMNKVGEAR
jgi:hypothetical protein